MEVKEQVALEKINVIKEVRDIIANKGFYFTPQEGEEINMLLKKICADASKDLAGCNKETQKANPDIAKVATSAMTDAITYGADGVRKFIRMVNEETARKLSEKRLKKATGVERSQKEGEVIMATSTSMMDSARRIVMDYFNAHVDKTDNKQITMNNVFVVWFSKTLQNWKALVSTTVSDGMYYEITYNGDKDEIYVDVYKKWENFKLPGDY